MTTQVDDDITLVPKPSKTQLNQRQLEDYRQHRFDMARWLLHLGKNPEQSEGYAKTTVKYRMYRIDQFYRWVWNEQSDGYTTRVTHDHADNFLKHLAYEDKSNTHKNQCLKALKMLFKWRSHELGEDQWEPEHGFKVERSKPQDYLTENERGLIEEAALEYGSIPAYNDLSPEERSRWKAYLAQRLEKPKSKVSPSDWKRVNGWKTPSLVWTSLDAGLRPVEVKRAKVSWVDTENNVLRIPKQESSKNRDNWIVSLRRRTGSMLEKWLEQRRTLGKYDGSDALWLTREGNRYSPQSLRYLLRRLCDVAGVDYENRSMSWYSIRHSTGTYMAHEEDLGAAQEQLRHRSVETTMKYDHAPVEKRRDALDRMG